MLDPTVHNTAQQNTAVSWSFPLSNSNGKEKDYESGFHYYGARYYWSELLTGWLSVDPMADKYPSISPYAYCAWNPVKLVDPDGRDIYRLDISTGSLTLYKKTKDKTDQIRAGSYSGIGRARKFTKTNSISISKGVFDGQEGKDYSKTGFTSTGGNQEAALDAAKFISFNSHIEISGAGFSTPKGEADAQVFRWDGNTVNASKHNPSKFAAPNNGNVDFHFHTHPGASDGSWGTGIPSAADMQHAQKMASTYGENGFYIISLRDGVTQYNQFGVVRSTIRESIVPKSLQKHLKNEKD